MDTAAKALITALVAAGVDTFFGIPGGPVMPVFDALLRSEGARLVESRHETNAAFAAIGYYRATGKVPAVIVTAGPGITNTITGIVAAHLERIPMIVISGDAPWAATGGVHPQSVGPESIGIERMVGHVVRAAVRVARPEAAAAQALSALDAAVDPYRPGPSLLVVPLDQGAMPTHEGRVYRHREERSARFERSELLRLTTLLSRAERPLLVLGAGLLAHPEAALRLVNALGVPFMTTPRSKGLVSEEHPLSLRHGGLAASYWARRYTGLGVDVALVLGTDLDDSSVGPTPPIAPSGKLIHVDLNAGVFGRNYRTFLGITAELSVFSHALADVAESRGLVSRGASLGLLYAKSRSPFENECFREDETESLAPHRVIHDLEAAAPKDAIFVSDIGEHMLFALHYLTAKQRASFVIHLGLGSMGSGICSAIGLAMGDPDRRVVCICGDGGMQMAGTELLVAVRERLPIVYAVFNDGRYNMVYHGYRQQFGRDAPWSAPPIDFTAWASSMGIPAVCIERPGQITSALLEDLTSARLPAVLDIRHDRNIRLHGAGRVEALARMSGTSTSRDE